MLLLSRFLIERLIEEGKLKNENFVDAFLRMEQICAYVRHHAHAVGGDIRGIDRVRANKSLHALRIGSSQECQIMSNQQAYGLWGLFTVAARTSDLIGGVNDQLSPRVRDFTERRYLPRMEVALQPINQLLCDGGYLNAQRPDRVYEALAPLLSSKFDEEEISFYRTYLCEGCYVKPEAASFQTRLAQLVFDHWELATPVTRQKLIYLRELARTQNDDDLHRRLDQVIRADAIMLVVARIFEQILSRDRFSVADVARELSNAWGNEVPNIEPNRQQDLLNEINLVYDDPKIAQFFDQCQLAICEGQYADVVNLLVRWNQLIQSRRGGAPWVQIGSNGCLDVRYRNFERPLPTVEELGEDLQFSYFLGAFQSIAFQLNNRAT